MLSEDFVSSICGPPIAANTAVSKDIGIYTQTLTPSYAVKSTFKRSWALPNGLAVSDTHVFAAQDQKAHVHVYSRLRGNQEALVAFPERIHSIVLAGNVLILGTVEGRVILWETCTGRQITTPPCHVQAVSCLAVTPDYLLSASDDSNINVWSLAQLLELDSQAEHEPLLILSNHRGGITGLAANASRSAETSICVSASRDKTCIIWNYRTGQVLRTLLFPAVPLSIGLDPFARALFVASDAGALYLVEMFGDQPLIGSRSTEPSSIVVQISKPLGIVDEEAGPASCLAVNYDGTTILTGHTKGKIMKWSLVENSHPIDLANLNAAVTNLAFMPLLPKEKRIQPVNIVKPNQALSRYNVTAQLEGDLGPESRLSRMLNTKGFSEETIRDALLSMTPASANPAAAEDEDQQVRDDALWAIVNEQRSRNRAQLAQFIGHGPGDS